ncbi:MAG: hypothetical protein J6W64_04675 [Bacilli bacterium]|nr:hypothetical protein [Bacilli bacterium]
MVSNRQKSLKKKSIIFGILSYGLLFALAIFYMISAFVNFDAIFNGVQIFTEEVKKIIISMSITLVIGGVMTIFLKEGMRTFTWIVCVVLGSLVYNEIGMYVALGCWLIDDYVIHKLFKHYYNKLSIRKEIDYEIEGEIVDGEQQE